ncbi:MAG: FHA domain-containing protein [Planctomycetota bacterium]
MAQIIVKFEGKENIIQLEKDTISLGRIPQNDVILRGENVSRRHCEIRRVLDGYTVVDLESRNGVFVNGLRVKEKKLEFGDRIAVGEMVVIFEKELPPSPATGESSGAGVPINLPVRAAEDFLIKPSKKIKLGWFLVLAAIIILVVLFRGKLNRASQSSEYSPRSDVLQQQSGNTDSVRPLLPDRLTGQLDMNLSARLERLMEEGRDFESNHEFGLAVQKYEEIIREAAGSGEGAVRPLVLKNTAQSRLQEIGLKADAELQVLRDLLKEAELTGRSELYNEVSQKTGEFSRKYQGAKWTEPAQQIAQQIQSQTGSPVWLEQQESMRLLNLAAGYRQEKKLDLARMLYEKIITDYPKTEAAAQARPSLEEMK